MNLSIPVVLLALAPGVAVAQGQQTDGRAGASPATTKAGFRAHRGLYVNARIGLGELSTTIPSDGEDTYAFGGTFPVGFEVGLAATSSVVIFADAYDAHVFASLANRRSIGPLGLYGLGPGAKYYFNPSNTFVSGSLLFSQLRFWPQDSDSAVPDPSRWGMTARLAVGREWWLGPNWAAGLSGEVTLGRMAVSPVRSSDPELDYTAKGFALVFSGSFNYPPSEAPDADAAQDEADLSRGYHTHDGFYADARMGVGYLRGIPGEGRSYPRGISIGGALSRGFVLFGEYYDVMIYGPTSDPYVAALQFRGLGPGGKYYLMPWNAFISGSLLLVGRLSQRNDGDWRTGNASQIKSTRIAGRASLGKEWWVSANWGIGVAGEVLVGRLTDRTMIGYSLLLSASFN